MNLIKKLRKVKKDTPAGEKPDPVRTHLRNMIIVPEMIGSIIGVYNGKTFNQVITLQICLSCKDDLKVLYCGLNQTSKA